MTKKRQVDENRRFLILFVCFLLLIAAYWCSAFLVCSTVSAQKPVYGYDLFLGLSYGGVLLQILGSFSMRWFVSLSMERLVIATLVSLFILLFCSHIIVMVDKEASLTRHSNLVLSLHLQDGLMFSTVQFVGLLYAFYMRERK
jgi:hypothetical protein